MRKNLFFIVAQILSVYVFGQCETHNLEFGDQYWVDKFPETGCNSGIINNLTISNMGATPITNLNGLSAIEHVLGNVVISNITLVSAQGLNNIKTIGGNLTILGLPKLGVQNLFNSLVSVGGDIKITGDYNTVLSGFTSLTNIGGNLDIGTGNVVNLSMFQSLQTIGGYLYVGGNPVLDALSGFGSLNYVGGAITFDSNPNLVSFPSFTSMISYDETISVFNCPNLIDLSGFSALIHAGGIRIEDASALTNLGLLGLTNVGKINISNCDSLVDLKSLINLTEISGFELSNSDNIESLEGLDNVKPDSISQFSFINNSNLSTCAIVSVCEKIAMELGSVVSISASGNAPNCATVEKIVNMCGTLSFEEQGNLTETYLFPNPVSSTIKVITNRNVFYYEIYDITGKILLEKQQMADKINIEELNSGFYLIKLIGKDFFETHKILKQ